MLYQFQNDTEAFYLQYCDGAVWFNNADYEICRFLKYWKVFKFVGILLLIFWSCGTFEVVLHLVESWDWCEGLGLKLFDKVIDGLK
jgi:hypothetical protein